MSQHEHRSLSGAIASKHLLDVVGILQVDMPKIASKEGCENVREDAKERY